MPTYEYLCRTCSHQFETHQKMTDEPLTTCPECGGNIRRILFPASVVFKGSGFYKTDHSNSGPPASENGNDNKSEKSESAKSESGKEGETKVASESKSKESTTETSNTKTGENKVAANTK